MKKLFPISFILGVLISLSIHSLNAQISYNRCENGGEYSSALGDTSITTGNYAFAFGQHAGAFADYSFAFGRYAKASAANSFSFGTGISGPRTSYLTNDTPNSFLIGFDGRPVLFAQLSSGDIYSDDLKRVGIGTKSPKTALDVEGTIRAQKLRIINKIEYIGDSLTIDAGTEGFVSHIPGGHYQPLLTLKDGKVGILNSNPTVALDVGGDMKVEGFEINSLMIGNSIKFTQPTLSFIKVSDDLGDTAIVINPDPREVFSKSGEPLQGVDYILTMNGTNVGIGARDPISKLHVAGHSYFNGTLLVKSSTDYQNEADIAIKNKWFFTSGASNVIGHNWRTNPDDATDMARAYYGKASAIFFDTDGNIRMRSAASGAANSEITSFQEVIMANNGNFGVGVADGTPKQKLHVAGNAYVTDSIGIGIRDPKQKLHVAGNACVTDSVGIGTSFPRQKLHVVGKAYITDSIGIGVRDPKQKLHVVGNACITNSLGVGAETTKAKFQIGNLWTFHDGANDKIIGRNCYYDSGNGNNKFIQNGAASRMYFGGNGDIGFEVVESGTGGTAISNWSGMYLKNDGCLGIGTKYMPNNYKLAVKGKIICEEVVVKLYENWWADYVFEPDYDLMPLAEVEEFIQEHKHLPEIPSAAQVEENGIGLAEMNVLLLKKVEELTLYIIEQEKRIETLEKSVKP